MSRYIALIICIALFGCDQHRKPEKPTQPENPPASEDSGSTTSPESHPTTSSPATTNAETPAAATAASSTYIPFPSGYGYMENLAQLQQATNEGNRHVIRQHAWSLWAGIMQPSTELGWPLWYSWPNTQMAFESTVSQSTEDQQNKKTPVLSIIQKNRNNIPDVNTKTPIYDIPAAVKKDYPGAICTDPNGGETLCSGTHFLFNGDILIPTESLSKTLFGDIRSRKLYLQSTLDEIHKNPAMKHLLELQPRSIVTKHMYWPVQAEGITGIPVWQDNFSKTFTGYAGYEEWDTFVAVDPSDSQVGETVEISFLYGVKNHAGQPMETQHAKAMVHSLEEFYYHQVTPEDWESFDDGDKAILNAASYWANNQPFGPGDYLVSIAMHVNTRELPSWTLQSVWWSDTPDEGSYSKDRPALPQAQGPWDHYLLTDAYAIPPNSNGEWDIAFNPYIEGVIHPVGTNCRNCHVRAGWPTGKGEGQASYQNPDCPGLLDSLTPSSPCLQGITRTDYLWIIPDRAH